MYFFLTRIVSWSSNSTYCTLAVALAYATRLDTNTLPSQVLLVAQLRLDIVTEEIMSEKNLCGQLSGQSIKKPHGMNGGKNMEPVH